MNGIAIGSGRRSDVVVATLLAMALFVRLIVPTGWMPVAGNGYAITLCTGAGMVSAWVDDKGVVHKDGKGPAQKSDHPCTFSGFSADLASANGITVLDGLVAFASLIIPGTNRAVTVGRGLAAPPPPQTGPPASL